MDKGHTCTWDDFELPVRPYFNKVGYWVLWIGQSMVLLHRWLYYQYYNVTMNGIVGKVVHHVDGDVNNNRKGNFQLMTIGEHMRLHNTGVKQTKSWIEKRRISRLSNWPTESHIKKMREIARNWWSTLTLEQRKEQSRKISEDIRKKRSLVDV